MTYSGILSLSIIIPYYTSDDHIGGVLEDLLHQDISTDEYEIIIVDDGSTEKMDTLRSYCAKYSCVRYILISHADMSTARNVGLEAARGEYIFFCDSDDRIKRNVFGHLYEVAVNNKLDALLFNPMMFLENESLPDSWVGKELNSPIISGDAYFACHPDMCLGVSSYISRREFLIKENLCFPKNVFMVEDKMFTISLMLAVGRVSHIDTDAYFHIQRADCIDYEAGKIRHAKMAADGRLLFIQYMNSVLKDQRLLCRESIKKEKDFMSFITLHNAFCYLNISQNWHILRKLRDMDAYPINGQIFSNRFHRYVYWAMNHSVLWVTCCVLFNLIPGCLRKRL